MLYGFRFTSVWFWVSLKEHLQNKLWKQFLVSINSDFHSANMLRPHFSHTVYRGVHLDVCISICGWVISVLIQLQHSLICLCTTGQLVCVIVQTRGKKEPNLKLLQHCTDGCCRAVSGFLLWNSWAAAAFFFVLQEKGFAKLTDYSWGANDKNLIDKKA